MKALSLKQPYADLVADGVKTIETRTWKTHWRGPLLICVSKSIDWDAVRRMEKDPILKEHLEAGRYQHNLGSAICTVDVISCHKMLKENEQEACISLFPRAQAWILRNVQKIVNPFHVKGELGVFDVDYEIVDDSKGIK